MEATPKKGRKPKPNSRTNKIQGYVSQANRLKADAIIARYEQDLGYQLSTSDIITILIENEANRLGIDENGGATHGQ